jgi:hypothetical protein
MFRTTTTTTTTKKKESIRTRFLSTLEVFAVKTRDYESCKSKKNEKDIKPHI